MPVVGKAVVTRSLRTRDPEEAKRLHSAALLALDNEWERASNAPLPKAQPTSKSLSEREAQERAGWLFDMWLSQHRDSPSEQAFWPTNLYPRLWSPSSPLADALALKGEARLEAIGDARRIRKLEEWCFEQADDQAAARNWTLDSDSRLLLARALAAAMQRASLLLEMAAKGEPVLDEGRSLYADKSNPSPTPEPVEAAPVLIVHLMEGWWREAKSAGRKQSTYESYRNTIDGFRTFLGHDDASRVSAADVVAYKDYRLTTPSSRTGKTPSAKTVKDSDLSALKAVLGWAASNHMIASNPAKGITIKIGKPRRLRSKGFTDDEANALLLAAQSHDGDPVGRLDLTVSRRAAFG